MDKLAGGARRRREGCGHLSARMLKGAEAEEVTQEAFVRGYLALSKLRRPERFFAWLAGIAERIMLERYRARRRDARLVHALAMVAGEPEAPEVREESDEDLRRAIARLPETCRQMILLRYYAGLSCAQVAEQLGKPLGTVTKTLSRAYDLLREMLQEQPRPTQGIKEEVRP